MNYPLLSVIRIHFAQGRYYGFVIPEGKNTIESVEGYPVNFYGSLIDKQYYNSQVSEFIQAENGPIFKIDRLLDPYASTLGISPTNSSAKPAIIDTSPKQENKTMTDLVIAQLLLFSWIGLMEEVLPAILRHLRGRRGAEGKECTIPQPFVILPSNEAFSHLPGNYN